MALSQTKASNRPGTHKRWFIMQNVASAQGKASRFTRHAGLSSWEYTLTTGFNVMDHLLIRAEYRMDGGTNSTQSNRSNVQQNGFGSGPSYYAGVEVVYSFQSIGL